MRISDLDQLHIDTCDGCNYCDYLLRIYGWCCICEIGYHKEDLYYFDKHSGDYYCENCTSFIPPIYKTNYEICDNCNKMKLCTNIWIDRLLNKTFCYECNGFPPKLNDPYSNAICDVCKKRGWKKDMIKDSSNDKGDYFVCVECNQIHDRTEILDL